jgi:hypothetical protein
VPVAPESRIALGVGGTNTVDRDIEFSILVSTAVPGRQADVTQKQFVVFPPCMLVAVAET